MPGPNHRLYLPALLAVLMLSRRSLGQSRVNAGDIVIAGDGSRALEDYRPVPSGTSLPDSPGAVDLLKRASREELQKHWDNAADLYQKAISQFPGRVVEVQQESGGSAFHSYLGIAPIVQERLAKWPDEGLKIYGGLYEQPADELLHAAAPHTAGPLLNIFWNYFATDAGKSAGIRLIDFYLETGHFQAAKWISNRLLSLHPALGEDRAGTLYRAALASHYMGDDKAAHQWLGDLQQSNASDTGLVGGKEVGLVDSLAALLAKPVLTPTTRPADADNYPQFGGLDGCGEVSTSQARLGPSHASVQLTPPEYPGSTPAQLTQLLADDRLSNVNHLANAIIPVVDKGSLFFQDGRSIYALDGATGTPLPAWLERYPGKQNGRYKLDLFGRARNELLTVTVSPAVVLAVIGQADPTTVPASTRGEIPALPASTVRLVCLDRTDGKERWISTPKELPDVGSTLSHAEYDGSSLIIPAAFSGHADGAVAEDSVLITARTGRQNQFDECYLVCLSLKSGKYLWSTYLGGATHNTRSKGDPSQFAFANGRVFVMTNLGAIASVDPADGRILWLNSYPHEVIDRPISAGRTEDLKRMGLCPTPVWEHNPVIVVDDAVFVLPNDSGNVFAFDVNTGSEITHLPMGNWDDASLLLGIRQGLLLLNSNKKVFAVDWRNYTATKNAVDSTNWSTDISFIDNSNTCGRGFVTADSIFIPTTNRLVEINHGRIRAVYPVHGQISKEQRVCSVLATTHSLVLAGQNQVDICTNPSQ